MHRFFFFDAKGKSDRGNKSPEAIKGVNPSPHFSVQEYVSEYLKAYRHVRASHSSEGSHREALRSCEQP